MLLEIITTTISAVATISAAVIGAKWSKANRQRRLSHTAIQSAAAGVFGAFAYSADSARCLCEIGNIAGDARHTWEYHGVSVRQGIQMDSIPGRFEIAAGRIAGQPLLSVKSGFPKAVQLRVTRFDPTNCEYLIGITGGLTAGDPKLDYSVVVDYIASFRMTRAAAELEYRTSSFHHEYLSMDIVIPLHQLDIDVLFPAGYAADAFSAVFIASTEVMDHDEVMRVSAGLTCTARGAHLTVSKPMVGRRYCIYWIPQS